MAIKKNTTGPTSDGLQRKTGRLQDAYLKRKTTQSKKKGATPNSKLKAGRKALMEESLRRKMESKKCGKNQTYNTVKRKCINK